jgi:hypothetical protein
MRTFLTLFLALEFCWFASGCNLFYGESTAPTFHDIPGEYALVTYDGKPLPYRIDSALSVHSDTLFLFADGAYKEVVAYEHNGGDISAIIYSGRYSFDGAEITITFDSGGGFILEIPDKKTLTENDGNGVIVYQKP